MRARRIGTIVFAIALLVPAMMAEARDATSATRRTVEVGRSAAPFRVPPASAGLARLGGLTPHELKSWAAGQSIAPASARYLHSLVECTTTVSTTQPDSRLDCDSNLPNNEPDVEVDPLDPMHIVASSNDYDSCCDGFYTSFDGGQTWTQGNMSAEDVNRIGSDPVTVFEPRSGNVIHASLNFLLTKDGLGKDGDLVVSISHDGGVTWGRPVVISDGQGDDEAPTQYFNDKEWIVVDTNPTSPFYGRTYVTWSRFLSHNAEYAESPIFEAHSDDGGVTWSTPHEIDGSGSFCDIQYDGPVGECDENQFSVPTVGADGTVYVAFQNEQNSTLQEPGEEFGNEQKIHDNQYLVVRSADGGVTWSNPVIAATLEDGPTNYPINGTERQTLTGYQVRVNSAGNIVAGAAGTLYLVWSDNRNGTSDPHAARDEHGRLHRDLRRRRHDVERAGGRRRGCRRSVVPVGGRRPHDGPARDRVPHPQRGRPCALQHRGRDRAPGELHDHAGVDRAVQPHDGRSSSRPR